MFHMPPELSAGMVLVGSVASGTASNVMIYLAKGDVALSVTISSVSTLVGVVATPLLTRLYVDAHIQADVMGMLLSILQIVVIPIALGLVIHHLFPRVVKAVEPYLPAFSMVCILAIISAVAYCLGWLRGDYRGDSAQHHWPARRLLGRETVWLR